MDRIADLKNCKQTYYPEGQICNHGGDFLDRYDWGYTCGNCGATFIFKLLLKPAEAPQERGRDGL